MRLLRDLAIIGGVWTAVSLFSALSLYIRSRSGELRLSPGWLWGVLAAIPVWTAVTPVVLAVSRRLPLERRTWHLAVLAHGAVLMAVLCIDGLVNIVVSPRIGDRELTYWQQVWRYSFVNEFFYAGVVAVEHAGRYYRLYADRRVLASELEAQVSRAQLQALQMQIRPHFLFNTLNAISGLVRTDDKAAAITMLAGLGDLLRLLLRSDGAQEVAVHKEIALIERYLQIEQVRFSDLGVDVSVADGLDDALVPNLILQPLVENAVRHGVGSRAGRVSVRVTRRGEQLRMEVADTGDAERSDSDSLGIGLANTRARLERLYGSAQRFELSHGPAGATAVIEIPLHHEPVAPVPIDPSRRGDGPLADRPGRPS